MTSFSEIHFFEEFDLVVVIALPIWMQKVLIGKGEELLRRSISNLFTCNTLSSVPNKN